MKKLLLAIASVLMFSPAWATFTVNNAVGNTISAAGSLTVTISIAAGHTAVVWLFTNGGTLSTATLTDSNSDVYTMNAIGTANSRNYGTAEFIGLPSAITSVTFNSSGSTGARMVVWDISATGTISVSSSAQVQYPFNTVATTNGTTSGTLSLSGADGLILGSWLDETGGGSVIGTVPPFVQDTTLANGVISEHYATSTSNPATWTDGAAGNFGQLAAVMLAETAGPSNTTTGASILGMFP